MTRADGVAAVVVLLVATLDSSSVFHALHAEHCPCHLLATAPHSLQTKLSFPFAII